MIYFGTDEGIYRWFEAAPWPVFHGLQGRAVLGLVAAPGGLMAALDGSGRLWETTDHGLHWREVAPPEGTGRPLAIGLERSPSRMTLWLATRPAVLHRKRPGQPGWVPLGTPVMPGGSMTASARFLAPTPAGWFLSIDGAGLWRSLDHGQTWASCGGLPSQVFALREGGDRLVAASSDGVAVSTDGGASWSPLGDLPSGARHVRAIEVCPNDPDLLLAGAAPLPSSSSISATTAEETAPAAPASRPPGLGFRLFESKDGGQSWSHVRRGFPELLEFDQIADIRFDPVAPEYAIVALTSGECWRTRNGGDWWEPIARQIRSVRALAVAGNSA